MKKPILAGHKRIGKRLIPPMLQHPMMTNTSYVNDMLPELVWVGLINERVGYIRGARILESIAITVNELKAAGQEGNYALMSSFKKLTDPQKTMIVVSLRRIGLLDVVRASIAPLIVLYDDCPLSFLGPPEVVSSKDELVTKMKQCVGKIIDRYDTPAIVLYGALLLTRLVTKKMHFPKGMDIPNFNAVVESPGTEEAKSAAGFMRASGLAEFNMLKIENTWAKHFWDRNFKLSACEFMK
jgi:hypothetical protein